MQKDVSFVGQLGTWAVRRGPALALAISCFLALGLASAQARPEKVPNKCTLAKNDEVAAVIGPILKPGANQTGPSRDEGHPDAQSTSCIFNGDNGQLVVTVLNFPSADQAVTALDSDVQVERDDTFNTPTVEDAPGIGDKAYWVQTDKIALYVASGNKYAVLFIPYVDFGIDASKGPLLKLTQTVLASN